MPIPILQYGVKVRDPTTQQFSDLAALRGGQGPTGPGVPAGGTNSDVLVKDGAADYAARWTNTPTQMGSLAYIETTSSVSKQGGYKQGDYLVYNGQLYKVTASTITQGQTLTPGGNIEAINVTDRIAILENKIKTTSPLSVPALNAGDYADIVDQSVTAQVRFVQIIDYTVGRILYPANWWNDSSTGYLNMRVYNLSSNSRPTANARFTYYLA